MLTPPEQCKRAVTWVSDLIEDLALPCTVRAAVLSDAVWQPPNEADIDRTRLQDDTFEARAQCSLNKLSCELAEAATQTAADMLPDYAVFNRWVQQYASTLESGDSETALSGIALYMQATITTPARWGLQVLIGDLISQPRRRFELEPDKHGHEAARVTMLSHAILIDVSREPFASRLDNEQSFIASVRKLLLDCKALIDLVV